MAEAVLERLAGARFRAGAHLAENALLVQVRQVTVDRHRADTELLGEVLDAHRAIGPHQLGDLARRRMESRPLAPSSVGMMVSSVALRPCPTQVNTQIVRLNRSF